MSNILEKISKISLENKFELISEIDSILKRNNEDELNQLTELLDSNNHAATEIVSNALSGSPNPLLNNILFKIVAGNYTVKMRSNAFNIIKNKAKINGNFLIDYCNNTDVKYKIFLSELLRFGNFTPRSFPSICLRKLYTDKDEIVRANAVESVGFLRLKLVQTLKKALINDTFLVKASAVFSLGELKIKSTIADLKYAFWRNKDNIIRKLIIDSIAKIDGETGLDFLIDIASLNTGCKRIDKIYLIKNIYRIYCENYKNKKYKNYILKKIQNINAKINILKLEFYEDRLTKEAILFYFSLSNPKKSIKIFNFLMDYLNKNLITAEDEEYKYIKESLIKVSYPVYIRKYLESISFSFETKITSSGSFFNSYSILIEILSENRNFQELAMLLNDFKNNKTVIELKIALLNASSHIIHYGAPKLSKSVFKNALFLLDDGSGDVRKAAADLIGQSKNINYAKNIYNKAINENYSDVLDSYIKNIVNLSNNNKTYFKFFANNINSNNIKIIEISLRIIKKFKISLNKPLNKQDAANIYGKLRKLSGSKSDKIKILLASVIGNFSNSISNKLQYQDRNALYIDILIDLLKNNNSEEIKFNSLESLLKSGFKDSNVFFEAIQPQNCSNMFKFKVIELIGRLKDKSSFDKLLEILHSSDDILIKISILKSLYIIDGIRFKSVIKNYLTDNNEDLRNVAKELIESD
ncbi:MAG: HEAT repeat domain-containing protein [bacterium]